MPTNPAWAKKGTGEQQKRPDFKSLSSGSWQKRVAEVLQVTRAVFPQRFRMLLASPAACYRLFREKQKEGQGEATMFKGKGTSAGRRAGAGAARGRFPGRVSFSGMPARRPRPPPALFRESEWDGRDV